MGKAAIEDTRVQSAAALTSLLDEAIDKPGSDVARMLKPHLARQSSLAAYAEDSKGIRACSLNTLKRACVNIPGGFAGIDSRRLRALAAIRSQIDYSETTDTAGEGSKRELEKRVKKLREKFDTATEDLMLLTRMLEKAMRQGKLYAAESRQPALVERCAREQAEIRDMMSLRQTAATALHIVPTEPRK